jgi:hypothetical protein
MSLYSSSLGDDADEAVPGHRWRVEAHRLVLLER